MRRVATYGVFDLFHEGHANLLRRARALGDHLTVGVTTDHFDEIRGKLDTVEPLERRMEAVRASGYADEVIPETYPGQKADDIRRLGIDVLVAGSDWTGKFDYLSGLCEVVYLPRTEGVCSTARRRELHGKVRFGVIGSGRIARKFASEATTVDGAVVETVYNPRREGALRFQKEFGLPAATDDLDELLEAVDAVYIASPHGFHPGQTRAALLAGKHVLCEKPLALARADAAELFELAEKRGLVLLEGLKSAYCPCFEELVDIARSGAIGEIRDVEAAFTRLTPEGIRERDDAELGGSFLEFGSHCLLPIARLLGPEFLENAAVDFHTRRDGRGVDLFTKAVFDDGSSTATVKTGLGVKTEGQLLVSGTEGYILAPAPWWRTGRFEVHHEDPDQVERYQIDFLGEGLRYEISNLVHLIWRHEGRVAKVPAAESIALATVMERYLGSRGLHG